MNYPASIFRAAAPAIECLEARIAPASLVTITPATKTATWTDFDGDLVTLKWTGATAPTFNDHTPLNGVAGSTSVGTINLTNDNDAITVTVKVGPLGGDGHVDLGYINSFSHALKSFTAPKASVLEFDCGDGTHAIGSLSIASYAPLPSTTFNTPGGSGLGAVLGTVGSVKITGDVGFGELVLGNGANAATTVGTVTIGGSLTGNVQSNDAAGKLTIHSAGATIKIAGSIIGGGAGHTGELFLDAAAKSISVLGGIVGGSAASTGRIEQSVSGKTVITIGSSVIGKANSHTGEIVTKDIASLVVGGDLQAGTADTTGMLSLGKVKSITIKGSIVGGAVVNPSGDTAGAIKTTGDVGTITIGHDIIVGSTTHTDNNNNRVTKNGAILIGGNVGSLNIGGSVEGSNAAAAFIVAEGTYPGSNVNFNAFGKITVKGGLRYAVIAAGQNPNADYSLNMGGAVNANAGIGSVMVGGDYYHTSIMAGINDGGTPGVGVGPMVNSDTVPNGGIAAIGSITIKGALLDDRNASNTSGFEATQIAKIVVGGTTVFAHSATPGQLKYLDSSHYVFAQEL